MTAPRNIDFKTIESFKKLVERFTNDPLMVKKYRDGDKSFVRKRKLTMERVCAMIIYMPRRPLNVEMLEFVERENHGLFPDESQTVSAPAFCKQRFKIKPELFFDLLVETGKLLELESGNLRLWHERTVVALDGTGIQVPHTKDTCKYFGTRDTGNGSENETPTPMAEVLMDPFNDIILAAELGKTGTSEIDMAADLFKYIPEKSVAVLDRYYPSYYLIFLLNARHTDFVIKCKKNFNKEVSEFWESGKTEGVVRICCTSKSKARLRKHGYRRLLFPYITLRIVRNVNPEGEDSLLLTNLMQTDEFPTNEIIDLYSRRWVAETAIGYAKNEEEINISSGIRPRCIEQDFYATFIAYNLERAFEMADNDILQEVNEEPHKNPEKIDKNDAWYFYKEIEPALLMDEKIDEKFLVDRLRAMARHRVPIRHARHFPRQFKYGRRGRFRPDTNFKHDV